ncbi:tetratricopeptide (TPR) repeat protein [Psychrobacter luti]|uniref:Tetratricopeptide (TPR) repeat protein n=1 Tax=Psychrobacter luti TaxID=198481 RepID=A0A839T7S0_9GAMM|nr:surface lipoprotein assembly modifier [Psychrobacter luti]MBB3105511.1 tetratricopeptide (TPR) repeat protein [Psychrobacter luti]
MNNQYMRKPLATSILLAIMAFSLPVMAEDSIPQIGPELDQAAELLKRENQTAVSNPTAPSTTISDNEAQRAIVSRQQLAAAASYNLDALKANPVMFSKFLNTALAAQDMETVKQLLPHYKVLENNDPMLIKFADALIYRSEAKNKQAIEIYREMLAADPDFHPVRLNMAIALLADKQYVAAKEQLTKLQAVELPAPVMSTVRNSLARINNLEQWQFNASASYVRDNNINDAPSKSISNGDLNSVEQQSANGIQVSGSANKRFNLPNNFYATVGGNASLKGYWDQTDYNDYLLTASTGVGYDDAKNDVSLTPFVTKRYYDEEAYSLRKGVTVSGSRWVKPKLKLSATTIFSNETFEDDSNANRETDGRFLGINAFYIKDAKEYFYGGLGNYQNDVPKSSIISYDRNSINGGWGREWKKGISTLTTAGYGIKKYDDPADAYAPGSQGYNGYYSVVGGKPGSTREDKTVSLGLQVWKRDFTLLGLTPRLVFDYETTSSNFAYYDDRDEKSATVLLTKSF